MNIGVTNCKYSVIVASCVRIVYMLTVDVNDLTCTSQGLHFMLDLSSHSPSHPDTFAVPGIWTNVELNASIICANLPVIYSLFKAGSGNATKESSYNSGPSSFGSKKPLRGKYEDLEMSKVTMHSNLHNVRIETGTVPGEPHNISDREPLSPPHVRREFRITAEEPQAV